jgi:hypothetical protein
MYTQLITLRANLASSHTELDTLRIKETFFDPSFPPALGYVEEVNEKDLKVRIISHFTRVSVTIPFMLQGSIRACEYVRATLAKTTVRQTHTPSAYPPPYGTDRQLEQKSCLGQTSGSTR